MNVQNRITESLLQINKETVVGASHKPSSDRK